MRGVWTIVKKEWQAYFSSPIAYVMFTVFLAIAGYIFYVFVGRFNEESMRYMQYSHPLEWFNVNEQVVVPFFWWVMLILLFVVPMFTMRMYAEEKKSGTLELLLTAPVTNMQVVLGKFFSVLGVVLFMLLCTGVYPAVLLFYGNPDVGPILSGYLGMVLISAAYIAAGSFLSAVTENQIVAAVLTYGLLLLLWIISAVQSFVGPTLGEVLNYLSITEHFLDFAKGVVDTKDVVFYLSFVVFGLFLTNQALEFKG